MSRTRTVDPVREPARVVDAGDITSLRAALRSRGLTVAQATAALAAVQAGMTRREVIERVIGWLRTRPKA